MPEIYTDDQIKDYATKLGAAGAPASDIEAFVQHAKSTQGAKQAVAQAPVIPTATAIVHDKNHDLFDSELKSYDPGFIERVKNAINDSDIRRGIFGPSQNQLLAQGQARIQSGDELRPQSMEERGVVPTALATARQPLALAARAYPALLSTAGGPIGAALNAAGEVAGQIVEPSPNRNPSEILANKPAPLIDKGKVANSAVIGAVPLGSTKGIAGTLANASKIGAGGYLGNQAEALIDTGKPSENAVAAGGTMAGIATLVPVIAKILGVATKSVTPEVAEKVAKQIRDNAETEASISKITDQGGVINPASQNPTLLNKTLGSLAGLQNVQNKMAVINAPVLTDIARKEAHVPVASVINEDTLKVARDKIMEPLNEIRGLGLQQELDGWQKANQARQDLIQARTEGQIAPAAFRSGLADAQSAMSSFEQTIDAAAKKAGKSELIGILPQIQEDLAKNYDVRRITPSGTGYINPGMAAGLAAQRVDQPGTLTGGLRDIANFSNAAYGAGKDINKIAPHSGTLGPHAALGAFALGEGPKAALSGGIMGMRGPIADLLLSPEYQRGEGILGLLGAGIKRQYPLAYNLTDDEIQTMLKAQAILSKKDAEQKPDDKSTTLASGRN